MVASGIIDRSNNNNKQKKQRYVKGKPRTKKKNLYDLKAKIYITNSSKDMD